MAANWAGSADKTTFRFRPDYSEQIDQLIENIQRLKLMNQAMWGLLSEQTLLTDKALEVDLGDGKQDDRMSETILCCAASPATGSPPAGSGAASTAVRISKSPSWGSRPDEAAQLRTRRAYSIQNEYSRAFLISNRSRT